MWKVLSRARECFAGDQRGNVAILFAFSAIPLLGLLGGAVDLARYTRHKTQIANAMDAAAVALTRRSAANEAPPPASRRRGASDDAEADRFVNDYIAAMLPAGRDPMLKLASFDATKTDSGYRVTSRGAMDTAFMPVIGIPSLPLDLATEVATSTGKYEVALALDNTGSMDRFGRIAALRDAAGQLVTDLYAKDGAAERVRMALIPFVTAVNIKTPGVYDEASWIAPKGNPAIFGPSDRLQLFKNMKVEFGGCVEARETEDEEDTEPTADAATRWVPYLWPDEPDSGYANSYLANGKSNAGWHLLSDAAKYKVGKGKKVANTTELGPNAACPRPIVELTNDTTRLQDEIGLMKPHNSAKQNNHSGTNVAQGLLWAWRVLSPGQPYDQGVEYNDEETTKVLVLLSDGRNQMVPEGTAMRSDYTSYGYLRAGRLESTSDYRVAERAVDAKVKRVCESVKAQGIRVYTILFQVDYDSTQDLFRDCASKDERGKPLYIYVPEPEQLKTAFEAIGKDLNSMHISR